MADFMAALANNGTVYRPRLIKQIEDRNGNVIKTFPVETLRTVTFDPKWMPDLKAAMINVVDDGTATVVHRDDMKIAAKTGTAQVGSKEHRRQIAWLSGYLPADNPQYSFSIMVEGRFSDNRDDTEEGGLLGGVEAGAIARDIFAQIYPLPGKTANETPTASTQTNAATETASADGGQAPAAPPPTNADTPAPPEVAPAASATTGAPAAP
jgi:penicillin-binding protein 2